MDARPLLTLRHGGVDPAGATSGEIDAFLVRSAAERARLLDSAAGARRDLDARRERLAAALAKRDELGGQVVDAQRAVARRRASAASTVDRIEEAAEAGAVALVAAACERAVAHRAVVASLGREVAELEATIVLTRAEADVLEIMIDAAFGIADRGGEAEQRVRALLDGWRRTVEEEAQAAVDAAHGRAATRLCAARIEAGAIAGRAGRSIEPGDLWPAPREPLASALDTTDEVELAALITELMESLRLDRSGWTPTLTSGGTADPGFADYPYPPSPVYPTYCNVELGEAQLVTEGAGAGEYYAASGRLNQVTVVDARDTDTGWTLTGTMGDFAVPGGGASFGGDQLGWTPKVTAQSATQAVTAGGPVAPGTASGLADGATLASAPADQGLGRADLDARLKLLIPVAVPNGEYSGELSLTLVGA